MTKNYIGKILHFTLTQKHEQDLEINKSAKPKNIDTPSQVVSKTQSKTTKQEEFTVIDSVKIINKHK